MQCRSDALHVREGRRCDAQDTLNAFMALGRPVWRDARAVLQRLFSRECGDLRDDAALRARAMHPLASVRMELPAAIGDYTDFYASRDHAYNVGVMLRGKDNALQPNWLQLPVGYHGRSSTVVVSGTPVRRPCGQVQVSPTDASKGPMYSPCRALDFELEIGCFVGPGNAMGEPIPVERAQDHLFGVVILNDWSARDVQAWEYVPLGPFTAKNFATTISPWVVTFEALEAFRCATSSGAQDPVVLPYLRDPDYSSYDVQLDVRCGARAVSACVPVFVCVCVCAQLALAVCGCGYAAI